eukprot:329133-Chlamydomonas_euryale.AAC.2
MQRCIVAAMDAGRIHVASEAVLQTLFSLGGLASDVAADGAQRTLLAAAGAEVRRAGGKGG